MKDFYKFIGSEDIREHLTNIGYEMSASECAYVVHESLLPLTEKHEAYKRIIDTMGDVQLPDKGGSLHEALKTKIELESILLDVFKQSDKAVYYYHYMDTWFEGYERVYAGWQKCFEDALYWREDAEFVRIEKKWITVGDEAEKAVSILFDKDMKIINVSERSILNRDLCEKLWRIDALGRDCHIPLPFERGAEPV